MWTVPIFTSRTVVKKIWLLAEHHQFPLVHKKDICRWISDYIDVILSRRTHSNREKHCFPPQTKSRKNYYAPCWNNAENFAGNLFFFFSWGENGCSMLLDFLVVQKKCLLQLGMAEMPQQIAEHAKWTGEVRHDSSATVSCRSSLELV